MPKSKFILVFLLLACLSGCKEHRTHESSKLPWARPTHWEQNNPQLGAGFAY